MNDGEIRLGVIGCGGFGLYALQQFSQVPGVRLTAMAGTHRDAAYAAARRFGIPDVQDVGALLQRDDVDLVYIATPPFMHHSQAMAALRAGKHVLCEKPLALTVAQADELINEANAHNRLLIANLMQRYNPVYSAVDRLIKEKHLGELLHGFFENYASDENLPSEHWFWDRSKSGGIFVEHGVHFFDLFQGWIGAGSVVAAQSVSRPGVSPELEEQVHCTVRYEQGRHGQGILVNFYHGFHQAGRMDRQELRLVFERGDVSLYDWVPTTVRIHAIVNEAQTRGLCDLFPGARLDCTSTYSPADRVCHGRHKTLDVYQMLELHWGEGTNKSHRYGELLRALLSDQVAWIRDKKHVRTITEVNGRDSLALACSAAALAASTHAPVTHTT